MAQSRNRTVLIVVIAFIVGVGLTAGAFALINAREAASPDPTETTPPPTTEPSASASATEEPSQTPTPTPSATSGPVDITTGLQAPWSIAFGSDAILISERDTARILELLEDGTTREVGVIEGVETPKEAGVLGLVVDGENRLYVYSTGEDGNRVQRYALTGEPGSYALGAVETIVDGIPSASTHNGGRMAIGPDGMLYVTTGDAGTGEYSQVLDSLAGKILRMTLDGDVPSDNPFLGSLVWSYGHRNVQGLAWTEDGTMFATEFGQDTWDELNVITPGSNYGWPDVEGIGGASSYVDPVQVWNPDEASPSGMTYLDGTLYLANLRGEVLFAVPADDPSTFEPLLAQEYGRLRDVQVAPDGGLWVLTNNTDGRGDPVDGDDRIVQIDPVS